MLRIKSSLREGIISFYAVSLTSRCWCTWSDLEPLERVLSIIERRGSLTSSCYAFGNIYDGT